MRDPLAMAISISAASGVGWLLKALCSHFPARAAYSAFSISSFVGSAGGCDNAEVVELRLVGQDGLLVGGDPGLVGQDRAQFVLVLQQLLLVGQDLMLVREDFVSGHGGPPFGDGAPAAVRNSARRTGNDRSSCAER